MTVQYYIPLGHYSPTPSLSAIATIRSGLRCHVQNRAVNATQRHDLPEGTLSIDVRDLCTEEEMQREGESGMPQDQQHYTAMYLSFSSTHVTGHLSHNTQSMGHLSFPSSKFAINFSHTFCRLYETPRKNKQKSES